MDDTITSSAEAVPANQMKHDTSRSSKKTLPPLPVVGIGASAGGLQALESLFTQLPSNTGAAFIVVQHLSTKFKTLMGDILIKYTDMPVKGIEQGMAIEPNVVYLISPGYELTIHDYHLHLRTQDRLKQPNYTIDTFFHSLADSLGAQAIAIVLSGTGSDGSRGIRSIKAQGGLVMVQNTESAQFEGMPRHAINTRLANFILEPAEMARELCKYLAKNLSGNEIQTNTLQDTQGVLPEILALVHRHTSVNFANYKIATILRRIEKVMLELNLDSLSAYLTYLEENLSEIDALAQEFLIGVTEFFRDTMAYEEVEQSVLPKLLDDAESQETVRIWICACSTGEEVYSLAILIDQYYKHTKNPPKITLIATDINESSLAHAAQGEYGKHIIEQVPSHLLKRYFTQEGPIYRVHQNLREMVLFARNDATVDPPFVNLDMVVCRNLLIYLKSQAQRRLLNNFSFALRQGGVLWLGMNESLHELKTNFRPLSERYKLFTTTHIKPAWHALKPLALPKVGKATSSATQAPIPNMMMQRQENTFIYFLATRFSPPCIFIDTQANVLYSNTAAGQFLHVPPLEFGVPLNLLAMVDEQQVMVIRDALRRFETSSGPFIYHRISLYDSQLCDLYFESIHPIGMHEPTIYIEWRPSALNGSRPALAKPPTHPLEIKPQVAQVVQPTLIADQEQYVEVTETDIPDSMPTSAFTQHDSEAVHVILDAQELGKTVAHLQGELRLAHRELQSTIAQLETSNEELHTSNEELMTSNEELQSTNEELQSVNEELYTVNAELEERNSQLQHSNADLDNLLSNTNLATLFVDKALNIRRFTPLVKRIFNIVITDEGRAIEHFTHRLIYPTLIQDMRQVLRDGVALERECSTQDHNEVYLVHMTAYTREDEKDGLVITFVDITQLKQVQKRLHLSQEHTQKLNQELEQRVEERTEALENVNKELSAFNHSIAHDLRTPLRAIHGLSQLFYEEFGQHDEASQIYIQSIQYEVERMSDLLDDLLALARLSQSGLQKSTLDMVGLFQKAFEELSTHTEAKVSLVIQEQMPLSYGDPSQMMQVASNLLSNAIKYSAERPNPHVEIGGYVDGKREEVVYYVKDNGIGFDQRYAEQIFGVFERLHNASEAYPGSGVGLAIIKRAMEKHGGRVWAQATVGVGATFYIALPQHSS